MSYNYTVQINDRLSIPSQLPLKVNILGYFNTKKSRSVYMHPWIINRDAIISDSPSIDVIIHLKHSLSTILKPFSFSYDIIWKLKKYYTTFTKEDWPY